MSIRLVVREWVEEGSLVILQPGLASSPMIRTVIATTHVRDQLYGPWETEDLEIRFTRARAVIDAFIEGLTISVRLPPSRSARAQLALLDNRAEEVWEFRSRDPKPGVRVFGCFVEPDLFLALTTELRENIDDDFRKEKEACKRAWRTLLTPYNPHRGTKAGDYLTNFHPT